MLVNTTLVIMAHLQRLYFEWLDQNLVVRIQHKSPPIIFSWASLGFGGNLSQLFFVNNPSILLRPDKYNNIQNLRDTIHEWSLPHLPQFRSHSPHLHIIPLRHPKIFQFFLSGLILISAAHYQSWKAQILYLQFYNCTP